MSLIQLLVIDSERRTSTELKKISAYLKKTPYFLSFQRLKGDKLLKNVVEGFAKYGQLEKVHQGQLLQKSGEKPDRVSLLIEGSVISLEPKSHEEIQTQTDHFLQSFPQLKDKINQTIPFQLEYTAQQNVRLKVQQFQNHFINRTRARIKSQVLFSSDGLADLDSKSVVPLEYLELLSKELEHALDGTIIHKDFWVQYFFEGVCLKFKKGKNFIPGEVLGDENDYQLRRSDLFLISQRESYLLVVQKRHFEELMKSLELEKSKKMVESVLRALDEGIRTSDLKVLAKEMVRVSSKKKVCRSQKLLEVDEESPYVYTVLKGEFLVSKPFVLDKEMKLRKVEEESRKESQYEKYRRLVLEEKQAQAQQQASQTERVVRRKKVHGSRHKVDLELVRSQELVSEMGNSNYKLLVEIVEDEAKKNELDHVHRMMVKKHVLTEFPLAKVGPNQLLGEQDFTHNYHHYQPNRFNVTCTSSSGKVLQIKKQDLFRLCYAFDWFAELWHTKCQNKYFWIQNRFRLKLEQFLRMQHPNAQAKQEDYSHKDQDDKIIAKFSSLKQKQQDLSQKSESADKIIQAKRQVQKKYYDDQDASLNCILLNREENQKNYEQTLKIKLISQNILPRENMGEVFLTSERVKGYSPVKASHGIKARQRESNSMKHKAAIKLKDAMCKTLNPQLSNPVKVYKSDLMHENCTIYQQINTKEGTYDKDIGLLSYLLKLDKKQQRLLQYTIVKNIRKRSVTNNNQNNQYSLSNSRIMPKDIEKNQKESFSNYQNLLQHVTKQHFRKIADSMQEVDEMKELPVQTRSFQKTAYSKNHTDTHQRESFDGRFSQGTINSIKIRNRQHSSTHDFSGERSKILSGHLF